MSRRTAVAWAAPMALLCLAAASCGGGAPEAPTADSGQLLEGDRRVAMLLGNCPRDGFYDRDLSDIAPVLLGKLELARPDPLRRAKEELGMLGTAAFPAMGNLFHAYFADPMRSPLLENIIDALSFSDCEPAHDLLIEALSHPQESVRSKAMVGLAQNARPEDFELLVRRLAIETRDMRRASVAAIFRADRSAAETLFLDAIEGGLERDLWVATAVFYSESRVARTQERCAQLFSETDNLTSVHLAACAASGGDAAALASLRARLRSEAPGSRPAAINAAERAGLLDELGPVLMEDDSPEVRAMAAAAFRTSALDDQRRTWLRTALGDPSPSVQAEALRALCAQRDEEGLARALAQLDGPPAQLSQALQALRVPVQEDHELAQRCMQRLLGRHALEEHRPLSQRGATFKAIGLMPLRSAAEFLHRQGVEAGEAMIESLRAHQWLMIQAANTGQEGRTFLSEALGQERDPLRRIDLIDAISSQRDDLAREFLLELIEDGGGEPLESLFAAGALVRVGPSWAVAPRLKRVAYAMQGPDWLPARTALQCLLWRWY